MIILHRSNFRADVGEYGNYRCRLSALVQEDDGSLTMLEVEGQRYWESVWFSISSTPILAPQATGTTTYNYGVKKSESDATSIDGGPPQGEALDLLGRCQEAFGSDLPSLDEDEGPASYFTIVES